MEKELHDNDFYNVGYGYFQNGLSGLQYVHHTQGKITKSLEFCGFLFPETKHYVCDYKYKKNLSKQDKEQLNQIESKFSEIVEKHGYRKIGESLWNQKKRKIATKVSRVNQSKFEEIIAESDHKEFSFVAGCLVETSFFKGSNVIARSVSRGFGATEYYAFK